ncbi:MAG: hypothetical protein ABI619_10320 [Betaproteobacteria bacterium]
MPTLTMFRAVSLEPDARSRSGSQCDDQDERIDELDARIEALHVRMQTVQRAVELQTVILEEIKLKGTIGGTKIPSTRVNPVAAPTVPTGEQQTSVEDALKLVKEKLAKYKEFVEDDEVGSRINAVIEALDAYMKASE